MKVQPKGFVFLDDEIRSELPYSCYLIHVLISLDYSKCVKNYQALFRQRPLSLSRELHDG